MAESVARSSRAAPAGRAYASRVHGVESIVERLTLEQKCRLIAGETNWRTPAIQELGVPQLKMSDGPSGVRGEQLGEEGSAGVSVPAGIALGASWDPELLASIGDLLGTEAVRKSAHVLLGPTINLHRTPVGGRTFECYSEDPELSGRLAASYIRGVQAHGVAVTPKHFVGNDTEIERRTVDVRIDPRTLRELYLRPFELAVKHGGAWGIMSSYNRLDGEFAAENRWLLTDVLRDEWGFDGFVVSDWHGLHDGAGGIRAGLSVEMPGPPLAYGAVLQQAVASGEVDEADIDAAVRDVLRAIERTSAASRPASVPERSVDDPAERRLTRTAAIAGTVLLRNDLVPSIGRPVLPLDGSSLTSVAVIGPNAIIDRSMGGGSTSLKPFFNRSLLEAIGDRLPDATIHFAQGTRTDRLTPIVHAEQLRTDGGEPGLSVEYFNGTDWSAPAESSTTAGSSLLRFFGSTPVGIDPQAFGVRASGTFIPAVHGPHVFGVVSTGRVEAVVTPEGGDPIVVVDDPENRLPRSKEFFGFGSVEVLSTIDCVAGQPVAISIRWSSIEAKGFAAFRLGIRPPEVADLIAEAVDLSASCDAAIVMVGTDDEWETEGFDRTTMDLPGDQNELVRRVVAANPATAVIVNAGSPVTMNWADGGEGSAPAVLTPFFGGQEQAEALIEVVLGEADPGGRLPITYPKRLEDTPAFLHHRPDYDSTGAPTQRYGEGQFIGYRWYDACGIEPRFPFGHGLSYGEAEWGEPTVAERAGGYEVSLPVDSVGERPVTVVVQGFVAPVDPGQVRPPKELKAWTKALLQPGETARLTVTFGPDAFHHWDTATNDWMVDAGDYDLVIARSATDEHRRTRVTIAG